MSTETIASLIVAQDFRKSIANALPSHVNADRMTRMVLSEIRKNPKLASCNHDSFRLAVLTAAQTGLELGGIFGQAYLVPYKKKMENTMECQLLIGYRGMIELAHRSGKILNLHAEVVRYGDEFDYAYGSNPSLKHKPNRYDGQITHVYASAALVGGGFQFIVMHKEEVDKIMGKSQSSHFWKEHYTEMAKKTAIRRLFKMLPVSAEIARAMEIHDATETGQVIDIQGSYDSQEENHEPHTRSQEILETLTGDAA